VFFAGKTMAMEERACGNRRNGCCDNVSIRRPETGLTFRFALRAQGQAGIGDLPGETTENASTAGIDIASFARGPGS